MKKQGTSTYNVLVLTLFLLLAAGGGFLSASKALSASLGENISAPTFDSAAASERSNTAAAEQVPSTEEQVVKQTYIVEARQTLWEIAQEKGVTVQTLMKVNGLSSSLIIEGQELVIQ
ncbi:LysM peptidoglycan-binding domain-containing protein [Enterococcus sp. UD-01]|jgi:LysM repeat protein|uniref:LysM peptidoglycan-binding domain-containing protein n=1 Tax=Enterococcus sp. UD-01 TaxID=3373911 RepID=UPI00383730C9